MNNDNGDFIVNIPSEIDKKQKRKKKTRTLSSDSITDLPQSPPQQLLDENTPLTSFQEMPQMLTREAYQREVQVQLEQQADKFNTYATQKSVSQNLLNTALITQYIGMLVCFIFY